VIAPSLFAKDGHEPAYTTAARSNQAARRMERHSKSVTGCATDKFKIEKSLHWCKTGHILTSFELKHTGKISVHELEKQTGNILNSFRFMLGILHHLRYPARKPPIDSSI
jgi:hypothetical protein